MSWRRWPVSWSLVAPLAGLTAPAAYAVDYLSADEAQRQLIPEADAFELREVTLDARQRDALKSRLGAAPRERWDLRVARHGGAFAGVIVVDDVIGKFERITYATAIGPDGAIRGIEILSYRESHGQEVRLPSWRNQFVGKTASSALRVGEDIANISGATLSCQHVTAGVRRIVAIVESLRQAGALR